MRWCNGATLLLLAAAPVCAAPPALDIPDEVKPVQGYARLSPKTDAVGVAYIALSGVFPFPSDELKDSKRFILAVTGLPAGRYKFTAVAASATGEFTIKEFVVPVGDAPVPPVPPVPPIPPGPTDPIFDAVQAAYGADTSPTKAADKVALAAVYGATAESLSGVSTAGDLFAVLKGATETRIAGRLKAIRSVFGGELEKVLPADPRAVLTGEQKDAAAKQLTRFAAVLGGVK